MGDPNALNASARWMIQLSCDPFAMALHLTGEPSVFAALQLTKGSRPVVASQLWWLVGMAWFHA